VCKSGHKNFTNFKKRGKVNMTNKPHKPKSFLGKFKQLFSKQKASDETLSPTKEGEKK